MAAEHEQNTRETDASGNAIYRIPEANYQNLLKRIEKMNKRAAKLKMPALVLTEVGESFVECKRQSANDPDGEYDMRVGTKVVTFLVRIIHVTLTGNCPRVNGWAMAATIQHEDGGNILRTVPGFEANLPVVYRTATTACDHCGTNRKRTDTYVLQSEAGAWKQVGRNCLADFLRTENASGLAEYAEMLACLDDEMSEYEEMGEGGARGQRYISMAALLTQVACCIRADGWCSRGEARNSFNPKQATVDSALICFDSKDWAKLSKKDQEKLTPTDDDRTRAAGAIEWAQALPADVANDYLWNIRVVSHREQISYREAGLAGSIISAYNRHLEQELAKKYERDHPSEYFGTVGEREVFTLTVIGTRDIESDFGQSTLVMFRDANGNRAKWFCSGECPLPLDVPVIVKATVKSHEEYKSSKQTLLTRVAEYDVAAEAQAKEAAKVAAKELKQAAKAAGLSVKDFKAQKLREEHASVYGHCYCSACKEYTAALQQSIA